MGMPVKISDALVAEAREEAATANRSITAQIEHWAKLGRSIEKVLGHDEMLALKQSGGTAAVPFADPARRERLVTLIRQVLDNIDRQELSRKLTAGRTASSFPGHVLLHGNRFLRS